MADSKDNLRLATPDDDPFLLSVYASTRQAELALLPWTPKQKQDFVRTQFDAQRKHYRASYPHAQEKVILQEATRVGRLYVDRQDAQILIVDLAVLPELQGRGIGRRLVEELQREATLSAKPITGHVERWNTAQVFWQRMGFTVTEDAGIYFAMAWQHALVKRAAT